MAITRDYLEPTDTNDHSETKFMDLVLVGWSRWTRRGAQPNLQPVEVGRLWKIPDELRPNYDLSIPETGFLLLDKAIACLPQRLNSIVEIEYLQGFPSEEKPRRAGLNRLAYRQRLHAAQWTLYSVLQFHVDMWRQKSL